MKIPILFLLAFSALGQKSISTIIQSSESIKGNSAYLATPYHTAGDCLDCLNPRVLGKCDYRHHDCRGPPGRTFSERLGAISA